jgi:hypothetical protein
MWACRGYQSFIASWTPASITASALHTSCATENFAWKPHTATHEELPSIPTLLRDRTGEVHHRSVIVPRTQCAQDPALPREIWSRQMQ